MRIAALVFGLVCGLALLLLRLSDPYLLRTVREIAFDQVQIFNPRPYADLPVRVVDIDEASLKSFGQWPWPRTRLAELVDRLRDMGAAAIAFDFVFVEPDRLSLANFVESPEFAPLHPYLPATLIQQLPSNDQIFSRSISQGNVVLGFAVLSGGDKSSPVQKASFASTGERSIDAIPRMAASTHNIAELDAAAAGIGSISLSPETSEGTLRRVPLLWSDGQNFFPSLALEALRIAQQEKTIVVFGARDEAAIVEGVRVGDFEVPTARNGEIWLYYSEETPKRYVSAKDILSQTPDEETKRAIAGNIIFVGTSAVGLLDIRNSARGERIPGVSVHAQALEQILSADFLTRPDWVEAMEVILLGLMLSMIVAVTIYLGPVHSLLFGGVVAFAVVSGSYLAFLYARLLVDFTFPLMAGVFSLLLMTGYRYLMTDRDKRAIRAAFAHYVAPSILKQIEKNPSQVRIGGEVREVSVMFLDVRSFTSLSERLSPEDLVAFLNRLFGEMTQHVVNQQGTLDKYIGDSIMAFWNAPVAIPQHQQMACKAALGMRTELRRLNAVDGFQFVQRGVLDTPIGIAIGIASGMACVGNIGSDALFNYSAIGDTVNIASRVQDACRHVAFDIVISGPVATACPELAILYAGDSKLKGKSSQLPLYILVGDEATRTSSKFMDLQEAHERLVSVAASGDPALESALQKCIECCTALDVNLFPFYHRIGDRLGDFGKFGRSPNDSSPALISAERI